jgi:hypothetical protein
MTMRSCVVVLAATLAAGCAARWPGRGPASESATLRTAMAEADAEASAGRLRSEVARYEAIVRQNPKDPIAAEALHRLAMLRLEPKSPLRDRRAGYALLRRLSSEHPKTLWGREARAWRGLVDQLSRCEAEATRRGADAEKLRQTLDSIRDSDLELEQHP